MKAHIMDTEALCAISPSALAAFARSENWLKVDGYGAHADVYAGSNRPEIIVPRTDMLADYASAVSRLIEIFATYRGSDELAVYRDLVSADRDVVRVRVLGTEDDGSVGLDAGVRIVAQARDMLLAAACAVRSPQPVYRPHANQEADDYMRRVKLGQTEPGSFVVTLLSPVPPLLDPARGPIDRSAWTNLNDEPLERMVTRRLMEALEASRHAAEMALSGDAAAFEKSVAAGVSANLCEAVAGLIEQSDGLDVSVTWARTRPVPETQRKVAFSSKDAEILKEAARTFRQRQPRADVTLFGVVQKLKGTQGEVAGVVTLKAMVDERVQPVSAVLDQANYGVAVHAHAAKTPVIVNGDLERVGHRLQMTNVKVRELQADEGDE
jgi:predicted aconitase with swiveling domain